MCPIKPVRAACTRGRRPDRQAHEDRRKDPDRGVTAHVDQPSGQDWACYGGGRGGEIVQAGVGADVGVVSQVVDHGERVDVDQRPEGAHQSQRYEQHGRIADEEPRDQAQEHARQAGQDCRFAT